jgi:hypothetical protein
MTTENDDLDRKAKAAWLIAGFRAHRAQLSRARSKLSMRKGVSPDVRDRGDEAYAAIIAEIDTQIRDLDFGWEPGPLALPSSADE